MNYREIITTDPNVRDGQPCVRSLPITVAEVIGCLASGMTIEQILAKHAELTREDITACLKFAADSYAGLFSLRISGLRESPAGWFSLNSFSI